MLWPWTRSPPIIGAEAIRECSAAIDLEPKLTNCVPI